MLIRKSTILLSLIVMMLTACATPNTPPTPTIVSLDRSKLATATVVAVTTPTRTPIPFPSPTPTPTPFSFDTTLTPSTSLSATTGELIAKIEVIATGLYLRAGPGLEYEVIGEGRKGDQFEVTGLNPSGHWFQIVTKEGDTGWISANPDYTRLIEGEKAEMPLVGETSPAPQTTPAAAPPTAPPQSGPSSEGLSGRLVFATSSGGALYTINADGSGLRHLADGVIDPVVSPAGQQVAFTRWDGAEVGTLYTLNLDDGRERVIMDDTLQAKSPTWSPDGTKIVLAFQHGGLRNPEEECREFDFDDTVRIPQRVRITSFQMTKHGIEVCFIRWEDLHWGLRRVEVETGQFEDLPADRYSYNPAWDPQNPWRVIYDGDKGLMQLDVTNNKLWPITTDLRDTGPVFSPDGQRLALTYRQHDHWEVYTLDLSGDNTRQRLTKPPLLADPQYSSTAPAWSPDGQHLAFFTDRSGVWEIWVMNADGSNPRPLFDPERQAELGLSYHGVNERLLNWLE